MSKAPAILAIMIVACSQPASERISDYMTSDHGSASVNGIEIYYEIRGEGHIPLVLLHGGGSTIQTSFSELMPLLAKRHRVIAVELQGHGRTTDRDSPESFEQDANDVAALLTHLKISKADLLGFSNGGQTAIQIAIRFPEVVNKLVIVSAFCKRAGAIPGFFDMMEHATLDNMPEPLKAAYRDVAPDPSKLQTMHDKDRDRMRAFKDWSDREISSMRGPALILIGDRDIVTPEHAAEMARAIPNSRLAVLPGTHGSFIGETCTAVKGSVLPEASVAIIEEFLKD